MKLFDWLYDYVTWCTDRGGWGAVLWVVSMTALCIGVPCLVMLITAILT